MVDFSSGNTAGGGGLTDGDYGDVVVSGGGTIMELDTSLFDEIPETSYAETITWVGTTAPTTPAGHFYRAKKTNGVVVGLITLDFSVTGTAITGCTLPFPSNLWAPTIPTGFAAAGNNLVPSTSSTIATAKNSSTAATYRIPSTGGIRKNAGNNGFELFGVFTATNAQFCHFAFTYIAA